ncbi:MAG: SpoIIE family protein phosphatase [Oleispira sp.]|nr:SpoIIE family protein phosphatase [Oleispira sp.]
MEKQKDMGDFSQRVYVEPHTEVGQIASEYNRVLDKVNTEMEVSAAAKRVIEAAHKKMRDSINYASLIQHSILPEDQNFQNNFSDYFVMWTPRDVIGGDVYLFTEFKDRGECLLMVIDCTGHGVPGAFVTMLVKAIERQVVGKINQDASIEISPGWILGYFNKTIKKLLHQEDPKSICNAGFDGGVLLYNKKKNLIKYAGAQLPLFLIQEGNIKLIKGDRHSVGYRSCKFDFYFKDNEIIIDKDSYIYLTTDGYIDQNGGDKKFPFGKKQLKQILLNIHKESFYKQSEILSQRNIEYKQQEETTDDVTIIGFKVESSI